MHLILTQSLKVIQSHLFTDSNKQPEMEIIVTMNNISLLRCVDRNDAVLPATRHKWTRPA